MNSDPSDLLREYAEKKLKEIKEFENVRVRCGIVGSSGSGKSSIMNAIAGEKIAKTGAVETTSEAQEFTHRGIILADLPGCGTQKWPRDSYINSLSLLSYDFFLLITAHRFTENDVFLFRELTAQGKHCFVVRNMIDKAIDDARFDEQEGFSEGDVRSKITADIRSNLGVDSPKKIYHTSARHPTRYDLPELLNDIANALEGLKRQRFVADMAAYGEEALQKKRSLSFERLPLYAGLAAANGFNPVPGLDIAVDVGILLRFAHEVAGIFGLVSEQFEYVKRLVSPELARVLLSKIAAFSAKYLLKEGILILLKQMATKTTAKVGSPGTELEFAL